MDSRHDDVEALAAVAGLLLEPRDPLELADRFLGRVAELFAADAGVLYLPGERPPRLASLGLDPSEAVGMAAELYADLGGEGERVAPGWRRGAGEWRHTLAAVVGIEPERRGLVALFSARPNAYDVERDGRLLRHMARHATAAIARARSHRRSREEAERLAVRAEEAERIRSALERHSREVERSLAVRGRYFALVSHELRTPLNAILGYAELLEQGVLGELPARQADAVAKVAASARHLLSLVSDVLDLAKLEAGRIAIRRQSVDLSALAAEAVAAVEVEAKRKGLELRVDCHTPLPPLRSDAARVRQILLNLLSNAVKFTDAGAVSLEVRHLEPRRRGTDGADPPCRPGARGWIRVAVEDTGPGIPRSALEAIFGEYVQLGAGPRGAGLGLAISRRLARLLGGELVAESDLGVRSTFALFLPCPAPAARAAADGAAYVPAPSVPGPGTR